MRPAVDALIAATLRAAMRADRLLEKGNTGTAAAWFGQTPGWAVEFLTASMSKFGA